MSSKSPEGFDVARFVANVEAEADRLTARYWGPDQVEAAARAYELAAKQALRAPVLAERSVVLRRVGKRILPVRLVPVAKRMVRGFDGLSKSVVGRTSRKGSAP